MAGRRALRFASLYDMPPGLQRAASVKLAQELSRQLDKALASPAKKKRAPARRLEHEQQVVFFNRLRCLAINEPQFATAVDRTFAIPNGGGRSKGEAGRLKAEGVKPGVSDVFCSYPSRGKHGLYIEMKFGVGQANDGQRKWIESSIALGYEAHVCWNADEAVSIWRDYVEASFPRVRT